MWTEEALVGYLKREHIGRGGSIWEIMRQIILKRDNYKCKLCGDDNKNNFKRHGWGNGTGLQIHHIDYDENNSTPFNLITLCPKCHGKTSGAYSRCCFDGKIDGKALYWKTRLSLLNIGIVYK